jgi:hypothetical protein
MKTTIAPNRVRPGEIATLLAWAQTILGAGPTADPLEQAAYLGAKADLLARLAAASNDPAAADIAAHAAAEARAAAALATATLYQETL